MSDNDVASKLAEISLQLYEEQIVTEQGYDDLEVLQSMSETELAELADEVKMKPGHKKKFLAAFNVVKVTDVPVGVEVLSEKQASSGKIRKQSTNPEKLKVLQEVEAMKKAFEEERIRGEKEAMARQHSKDMREMKFKVEMAEMKAATEAAGAKGELAAAKALADARVGQQQAAMPIVINNNNSASLSERSAKESEADAKKRAEEEAAKVAELEEKAKAEKKAFDDADLDPNLRSVKESFEKLDKSDWQHLNSTTLKAKLVPEKAKLDEATKIYETLKSRAVLIRPAFDKIAQGTSNTGKPKSPIDKKNHPWNNDSHLVAKAKIKNAPKDDSYFRFDDPTLMTPLKAYPYFKQQPDYKGLMEQMAIDMKSLNKAGRQATAAKLITTADSAMTRMIQREVAPARPSHPLPLSDAGDTL